MATEVKKTWRIVDTDNFGSDYPNEKFVAIDIPTKRLAEMMANALNGQPDVSRFYMVVEHEETVYKLQPGFEP